MTDTPRERVQRIEEPPEHIIDLAIEVSGWSPCRSKRGVVIFRGEDVVSHGYNYKPRGFDCEQTDECKRTCRKEAIHAEQQALLSAQSMPGRSEGADMLHVKTVNGALVASGGPSCVECSKLARACGIAGVWLYHEAGWRRYEITEFHRLSLAELDRLTARLAERETEPSRGTRIHTLKTWPEFFRPVVEGRKRHEVRVNDRDFRVGDCLVLQEFDPTTQTFTREMCSVRVTYVSSAFMPDGYVAMSIEPWAALASPHTPETTTICSVCRRAWGTCTCAFNEAVTPGSPERKAE